MKDDFFFRVLYFLVIYGAMKNTPSGSPTVKDNPEPFSHIFILPVAYQLFNIFMISHPQGAFFIPCLMFLQENKIIS